MLICGNCWVPTSADSLLPEQRERWPKIRTTVGTNIRRLRLEAGLTQEALALESGVTRNMLIHVEHGTRSVTFERLYDLAQALGVDASTLVPPLEDKP